ncbi:MAG: dihydroorotate dehydrogenase electron transfer subunit, partial [Lachnospiraceae bacterium]
MQKIMGKIISQERIAEDIFDLQLSASVAKEALPGQFLMVFTNDGSRLLGRPISICETDAANGTLRLVYRQMGSGTRALARLSAGEEIEVLGPLGNGFPVEAFADKKVLLIGGGIGIPPLVGAGRNLKKPAFAVGYRSESYLLEDLQKIGEVLVATEDGSLGTKGNVIDALTALEGSPDSKADGWLLKGLAPDAIFACGPMPMLRAVAAFAEERGPRFPATPRRWCG